MKDVPKYSFCTTCYTLSNRINFPSFKSIELRKSIFIQRFFHCLLVKLYKTAEGWVSYVFEKAKVDNSTLKSVSKA